MLEFGTSMCDVVSLVGNSHTFEDVERPIDHLKSFLIRNLFDWSQVWGFTQCTSIFYFQHSFSISI